MCVQLIRSPLRNGNQIYISYLEYNKPLDSTCWPCFLCVRSPDQIVPQAVDAFALFARFAHEHRSNGITKHPPTPASERCATLLGRSLNAIVAEFGIVRLAFVLVVDRVLRVSLLNHRTLLSLLSPPFHHPKRLPEVAASVDAQPRLQSGLGLLPWRLPLPITYITLSKRKSSSCFPP